MCFSRTEKLTEDDSVAQLNTQDKVEIFLQRKVCGAVTGASTQGRWCPTSFEAPVKLSKFSPRLYSGRCLLIVDYNGVVFCAFLCSYYYSTSLGLLVLLVSESRRTAGTRHYNSLWIYFQWSSEVFQNWNSASFCLGSTPGAPYLLQTTMAWYFLPSCAGTITVLLELSVSKYNSFRYLDHTPLLAWFLHQSKLGMIVIPKIKWTIVSERPAHRY